MINLRVLPSPPDRQTGAPLTHDEAKKRIRAANARLTTIDHERRAIVAELVELREQAQGLFWDESNR